MSRLRLCAAAAIAAAVTTGTPPTAQSPPAVVLDVAVESADGRPVSGLTREDFQILSGGGERPIELFTAGGDTPLAMVLLFDVSASMENAIARGDLRKELDRHLLDALQPDDRVHVGSVAKAVAIGTAVAGTAKAVGPALRKALDPRREDTYGPSPIWDAVDAAVTALEAAPGRRAILLMTDGHATGNRVSVEQAGRRAAAAGVTVSVIGEDRELLLRQDEKTGVRVRPGVALEWLANITGGMYARDVAAPASPGPLLVRAIRELRGRYTLGFAPAARDGKTHEIDIRVNRPHLTLRFRRSYVVE